MKWPMVPFAKVAEVVTGNTPPKKEPENYGPGVPWVKPPDLDAWEPISETGESLSKIGQKKARLLPAGTVMVCCIGSIGRVGIAGTTLATNQQINSLVFGPLVEPKFGYYYCRSISHVFAAMARQAVVSILNKSNFERIEIPLPPLSEQRRIVEILDQADILRKKRAEADVKAERILPALFYQMFGDPVTNPKNLRKEKLGNLIRVKSGDFLPAKSMVRGGKCPVYGGNGINGYHCEYMFDDPVVIIGRVGVYCGAIHYSEPKCWVTDNALYVAEMNDDLNEKYLVAALHIASLNQYAGRAGQPLLSASRIYPVEILVPPLEVQERYAAWSYTFNLSTGNRATSLRELETLFSVLLYRAFSGDLTAKWREAHMKELLTEMEEQAKALELPASETADLFDHSNLDRRTTC
jgi:type I restriction enzyme, S subunit